jgi:hypothetical protein
VSDTRKKDNLECNSRGDGGLYPIRWDAPRFWQSHAGQGGVTLGPEQGEPGANFCYVGKILSEPENAALQKRRESLPGLHGTSVKREHFWMDVLKREASPQLFT